MKSNPYYSKTTFILDMSEARYSETNIKCYKNIYINYSKSKAIFLKHVIFFKDKIKFYFEPSDHTRWVENNKNTRIAHIYLKYKNIDVLDCDIQNNFINVKSNQIEITIKNEPKIENLTFKLFRRGNAIDREKRITGEFTLKIETEYEDNDC